MTYGIAFLHSTLKQEDGWRQVLPAGHFRANDGRPFDTKLKDGWFLNEATAQRLINQIKAKGKIMVDNEHEYLLAVLSAKSGSEISAIKESGWIHGDDIKWQADGLWVKPRWTAQALGKIASNDDYGLSATFTYDSETGEPIHFLNVALTDNPALDELKGLTNIAALSRLAALTNLSTNGDSSMNEYLLMLLAALGLEATEENVAEVTEKAVEKINQLIAKEATADETIAELKSKQIDPLKYVPVEDFEALRLQVVGLSSKSKESLIDQAIAKGRSTGRLMKSEVARFKKIGEVHGIAVLTETINARAPIAALTSESQVVDAATSAVEKVLTEEQKEAARMLGIDEAEYLKLLLEQEGA